VNDYWAMHFDASPTSLRSLHSLMRKDQRVICWSTLRLGEKVEDVVRPSHPTTQLPSGCHDLDMSGLPLPFAP
ncbi:hypothetical protein CERSUDRAFT_50089, partial [Gelatoporia subvermispora B]